MRGTILTGLRGRLPLLALILFAVAFGTTAWASVGHDELFAVPVQGIWLGLFAVLGYLILRRHEQNLIGRLLMAIPIVTMSGFLTKAYAHKALIREPGAWPLGELSAWLSLWLTVPGFALILWLLVVYPTGRLPSRRWKMLLPVSIVVLAVNTVLIALRPGQVDGLPGVQNPMGVGSRTIQNIFDATVTGPVVTITLIAAVVSMIIRARRAAEPERQQIRVLAFAVGFTIVMFFSTLIVETLISMGQSDGTWLGFGLVMVGIFAIPVAIGVALLRYRLYEVDLVMNRTIVYGALTAFLAGAYLGGVTLLRGLLNFGNSDLAVAGSTLAVAALFHPARRRIQDFIDHYFYRRKYDAQQTIDGFSRRLRDEIDLEAVNTELLRTIDRSMHPAHVSVWLVESSGDRRMTGGARP